jgi:hypothetical protein
MNWRGLIAVGAALVITLGGSGLPAMAGDNPEAIYAKGMSY